MSKKILVVDDDPDILKLTTYILKEEGYSVVSSPTSVALDKLDKIKPDLVLLDCWLPGGFGDDMCRSIKAHASYKHIPVILISAIANLEFIAKECHANAFLEKPFEIDSLLSLVKRHIS